MKTLKITDQVWKDLGMVKYSTKTKTFSETINYLIETFKLLDELNKIGKKPYEK